MAKKLVLLIEDDLKTAASIKEMLKDGYRVEVVKNREEAGAFLVGKTPEIIIIDFDLKEEDGLQIYKKLGTTLRVIMISANASIPLAVSATKLGVVEFLRKPFNANLLRSVVEKNLAVTQKRLRWTEGMDWLRGESPKLVKMFEAVQEALAKNKDIILVAEKGVSTSRIAEFIHANSAAGRRKLAKINASLFGDESLETHFWMTLQELISIPQPLAMQQIEERYGSIYIEGSDKLSEVFLKTLIRFFKERKGNIDKSIRVMVAVNKKNCLLEMDDFNQDDYSWVEVPSLRERKADLPYILDSYLKFYSHQYNKEIKLISTDVLDFLATYDYPGNYLELERLIEEAVLSAQSDRLELANLPLNFKGILAATLKSGIKKNMNLEDATRHFEKDLYHVLLDKSKGDYVSVAKFLDVSRTALAERMKDLLD
jgi:DNA-binding NtrC family response regulator